MTRMLEIVRTAALLILAVAFGWIAVHGVTFHYDGRVNVDLSNGLPGIFTVQVQ